MKRQTGERPSEAAENFAVEFSQSQLTFSEMYYIIGTGTKNSGWSEASSPARSLNRQFVASTLGTVSVLQLVDKLAVQTAVALNRKQNRRKRRVCHDRSV